MKLTIGIPVYNGLPYLKDCLDSIGKSISESSGTDWEVLLSNNASTDESARVISIFSHLHPRHCRVVTNLVNLGYDGNIFRLLEEAHGEYIWFLGCQERLLPGAVETLLKVLEMGPDYVQLSFGVLDESAPETSDAVEAPNGLVTSFEDSLSFLEQHHGPAMALSANVVRRASWRLTEKQLKTVGWAHVEGILDLIMGPSFKKGVFIHDRLFLLFRESAGWWQTPAVYGNFIKYLELLRTIPAPDPATSKWKERRLRHLCEYPLRHSVALGRQKGFRFRSHEIVRLVRVIGGHPIQLVSTFFLLLMPRSCFRTDSRINCFLRERKLRHWIHQGRQILKKIVRWENKAKSS